MSLKTHAQKSMTVDFPFLLIFQQHFLSKSVENRLHVKGRSSVTPSVTQHQLTPSVTIDSCGISGLFKRDFRETYM